MPSRLTPTPLKALAFAVAVLSVPLTPGRVEAAMPDWTTYQHPTFGFTLRIPADWRVQQSRENYVRFQKGESSLPAGVPEVDVFLRVDPLKGKFPSDYLQDRTYPAGQGEPSGRAVRYEQRQESAIRGLAAVRARFQSSGPVPNWGAEYAIRKDDVVLDIYISQPRPEVEAVFDEIVRTLEW